MTASDWIGTAGVSILLLAYLMNLMKWMDVKSNGYLLLNALGAALAGYASILLQFWPFIILEGVWTAVSLYAVFQNLRKKEQN